MLSGSRVIENPTNTLDTLSQDSNGNEENPEMP